MINNVVIVGRITKDLELQTTSNNNKFVRFTVALDGERPGEDTNFIPCTAWNEQAEKMSQFLSKGSLIGVQGRISVRSYDSNGERKTYTEVVARSVQFLESKSMAAQRTQEIPSASLNNKSFTNAKPAPTELEKLFISEPKPTTPKETTNTNNQPKPQQDTIDWLDDFI